MVRSRKQDVPPRADARNTVASEPPRNYGERGIAALIAPVVRPAFRKRAPAAAALLADWAALAGADLAARAAPKKFAGGTLTLACTGAAAMELQHQAPQIIARLNLALGQQMVERLRFVHETASITAPSAPVQTRAPKTPPAGLPDGKLGEALAKLYQGIKS
jgi:hypothetical protein